MSLSAMSCAGNIRGAGLVVMGSQQGGHQYVEYVSVDMGSTPQRFVF